MEGEKGPTKLFSDLHTGTTVGVRFPVTIHNINYVVKEFDFLK